MVTKSSLTGRDILLFLGLMASVLTIVSFGIYLLKASAHYLVEGTLLAVCVFLVWLHHQHLQKVSKQKTFSITKRREPERIIQALKQSSTEIQMMCTANWALTHSDWIEHVLRKHVSLKILVCKPTPGDMQARVRTLKPGTLPTGDYTEIGVPVGLFLSIYRSLAEDLQQYMIIKTFQSVPQHWFCIIDARNLIVCNYCHGVLGGSSPHLYLQEADKLPDAMILLEHYQKVFDSVWNAPETTEAVQTKKNY